MPCACEAEFQKAPVIFHLFLMDVFYVPSATKWLRICDNLLAGLYISELTNPLLACPYFGAGWQR